MKASSSKFDRKCDDTDIVYYIHETRFDNGQLVDFEEKRRIKEKFEMSKTNKHEYIKLALKTMKKGEIVWIKIS